MSSIFNTAAANKLSKKKKNAIKHMDRLILERLSDYFTCWKLKVLLGQSMPNEDETSVHRASEEDELQLDFSVWRREI